mmetsp:Transcript_6346/g.9289  ORF Transcript_6346/g.9289 Transcript_6346/m.9289 type:complete len:640 (-) Transcript_6346:20-1939(-)
MNYRVKSSSLSGEDAIVSHQKKMKNMDNNKQNILATRGSSASSYEMREEDSILGAQWSAHYNETRDKAEDSSMNSKESTFKDTRKKKKRGKVQTSMAVGLALKNSTGSFSSSSTNSITRKQVNGSSKQGKFIRTKSTQRSDKSLSERVTIQKERSSVFNVRPPHPVPLSSSNSGKGDQFSKSRDNRQKREDIRNQRLNQSPFPTDQNQAFDLDPSDDATFSVASTAKSVKNRPGTPPPRQGFSYDFTNEPDLMDSNTPPSSPPRTSFSTNRSQNSIMRNSLNVKETASTSVAMQNDNGYSATFPSLRKSNLQTACLTALDLIGGIGTLVEKCVYGIRIFGEKNGIGDCMTTEDDDNTIQPMDTDEEELLDEINRLDRMNSWDTNGTFTTINTMGTSATNTTGFTADASLLDNESLLTTGDQPVLHDTRNHAQAQLSLANLKLKKRRKKRSKKKRKVNFAYPPISSMKAFPRISEEERKKLFFTEEELDEYEHDRRYNLCDDVEVVAVEFTDSDSSDVYSDEENVGAKSPEEEQVGQIDRRFVVDAARSSLRAGKYPPHLMVDQNQSSITNTITSSSFASTTVAKKVTSYRRKSCQSNVSSGATSAISGDKGRNKRSSGKIKGVQIYLRQRSVKSKKSSS